MLKSLIDLVFPPVCHVCGNMLPPGEKFICQPCIATLPRTGYHRSSSDINPMENRFAGIIPFLRATGHFFYASGNPISQLIHDFKYRHFPGIARRLGEIMGNELYSTGFFSGADMIMPVPLHFIKKAKRGYNQSEQLAIGLSKATGLPIDTSLRAVRPHRTQTALSHDKRRRNTEGLFQLRKGNIYAGKTIVVVDDVCTTGSTLLSASEAILRDAPGSQVIILSLGVTF